MPVYAYKAKTEDGFNIKGTIEANDELSVVSALQKKGYYPFKIAEQSIWQKELSFDLLQRVSLKDITVFCRQFSTMINAGVSILQCLNILRQQIENKKLQDIVHKVYEHVQTGSSLSGAMKEYAVFPSILISMIQAGEASSNLNIILERMAVHFEKENKSYQKIKGAMTYPAVVFIMAVIVVGILVAFVVPNFVSMFAGMNMKLPYTTRIIIAISQVVQEFWIGLLILILAVFFVGMYYLKTDAGRKAIDGIKLRIPIFGPLHIKVITSRFTRTLGTLLGAGLPLLMALELAGKVVDNAVVAKGVEKAGYEISQGKALAVPIAEMKIFPPMVVHMIQIGEETGSLETLLEKTADFYDEEVENAVGQMTTMLEPLIICVMAVIVGFIILSIVQPMFRMYEGVGNL